MKNIEIKKVSINSRQQIIAGGNSLNVSPAIDTHEISDCVDD